MELQGVEHGVRGTHDLVHQVHDLQQSRDPVELVQLALVVVVQFTNQSSVLDRLQGVESNEDGDL